MLIRLSLIFLSGLAMGTALGLVIAPHPGSVSIKKIKQEADRLVDKVQHLKEAARE